MTCVSFVKYHALGNDFIVIDQRTLTLSFEDRMWIRVLCHRQRGIGADGLIVLMDSQVADYRMRIFNSDGTESAMCGNGIRSLVLFLYHLGKTQLMLRIETGCGVVQCERIGEEVRVFLTPRILHWPALCEGKELFVVDTGVPHAVVWVDGLDDLPVVLEGKKIRHAPCFAPQGVNVNFARQVSTSHFSVRTYERGVEGETLACGTGAAAVAYVARALFSCRSTIHVTPFLAVEGERLVFDFPSSTCMTMQGKAEAVFEGRLLFQVGAKRILTCGLETSATINPCPTLNFESCSV